MNRTLTALTGVRVGHSTHLDKLTGCTVVLFDKPYPVSFQSYGGAAGTFNTEEMNNGKSFYQYHGLFIAGGSNTGLMSGSEIMQSMIEDKIGWKSGRIINPNIAGAIVFDLGTQIEQYDSKYAKEAYKNVSTDEVINGNVGAGTGTCVGKFQYLKEGTKNGGMKAGVGSARVDLGNGAFVCALSVVNAVGNIVNRDGSILAGNRDENTKFKDFKNIIEFVTQDLSNTTITIVGTNVDLHSRENYQKLAHFGTLGQARAILPVNTSIDGDTVFAFSTEEIKAPLNAHGESFETPEWPNFTVDIVGYAAASAVQDSIYSACLSAETIPFSEGYNGVIPAVKDYS